MFSLEELEILIQGLGTLRAEYGLSEAGAALLERLYAERDRRWEEIQRFA